ncbi:MAG: hypothetical protein GY820_40275 [Gammaproteobacteria bacterium]|nr:hypothetical protein [Gammaproteobacteria bacterium]
MEEYIAEKRLLYSSKNSSLMKELTIRIGKPYLDDHGMARCPIEWDGLFKDYADIAGIDLVHALHLATDSDSLLGKLRNKYDFFWADGSPYFDDAEE